MEIRVRKMDAAAVKKIDQLAKEIGVSREEFLRRQLNTMAFHHFNQDKETKYNEVIQQNMVIMEHCIEVMQQYHETIQELMGTHERR
ncbi:ribbon-helix-helix protein, CopG family [Alkalicoccobacillus gibsonii]|uniref:ribbon-helix-helix protein, CopG family n=1 Tax=Alkalicoccobacillus gibsonii TaxID=79881 RepID=UPI0019315356|nr:ribbon-helix-helix protein, CopG family [Alkalicoccobacillus gibsonii]MBM0067953.1 hypothetical protein [Alkalicoccobacillus gibsonii]